MFACSAAVKMASVSRQPASLLLLVVAMVMTSVHHVAHCHRRHGTSPGTVDSGVAVLLSAFHS